MLKTLRRTMAMAAVTIIAVAMGATPAQAHWAMSYTPNLCVLYLHASEVMPVGAIDSVSGTCDHDNVYRAYVKDNHAPSDGYCVRAVLQGIIMAVSCDSSGNRFTFTDPEGNYQASIWVCLTTAQQMCVGPAGGNNNY